MAEAVFKHLVQQAGLSDRIHVESAGIEEYEVGQPAHRGTLQVLQKHGIPHNGRARQLTTADLSRFDYILAMDSENLRDIKALGPSRATVSRLLDFAPELAERDIPDPWYNGRFEEVYRLVSAGTKGLLARIRQDHHL